MFLREQIQFRNHISIDYIPYVKNEDLIQLMMKICKKLGVDIESSDIRRIYRHDQHLSMIVVELYNYTMKNRIVESCKRIKNVETKDIMRLPPGVESSELYINHTLTPYYWQMVKVVKNAQRRGILYTYQVEESGLVVKRSKNAKERCFVSLSDLRSYIGQISRER